MLYPLSYGGCGGAGRTATGPLRAGPVAVERVSDTTRGSTARAVEPLG